MRSPKASVFIVLGLTLTLALLLAALAVILSRSSAVPIASLLEPPPLHAAWAAAGDLDATVIGVYLYPEDDAQSPAAVRMGGVGARWTRSWLSWDWIEPVRTDPPTYHWETTDAILLAERRAGLEPIFLLGGNAAWASDTFCGPIHPQAQADFQRFLRDLVQRYSVASLQRSPVGNLQRA